MTGAPYTIVNVKEVEDIGPKVGLSPNLEGRFARKPLGLEQSGLSYFRLAPGYREPYGHRHATQEEVYVVVSGSMRMKLDDDVVELQTWDAIRVAPHVIRCHEAGPNGVEMLIVGAPQAKRDGEIIAGWWE